MIRYMVYNAYNNSCYAEVTANNPKQALKQYGKNLTSSGSYWIEKDYKGEFHLYTSYGLDVSVYPICVIDR